MKNKRNINRIGESSGQDHEVSMANNSLDYIIKAATELKSKIGNTERDIPAWIQDHITKSQNYIHQANSGYHEYNESRSIKLNSLIKKNKG